MKGKVYLLALAPLLSIPLFSPLFAQLLVKSGILNEAETIFIRKESLKASLYNLFVFLILFSASAIIVSFLVKKRKTHLLKVLFTLSLAIIFALISEVYLSAFFILIDLTNVLSAIIVYIVILWSIFEAVYISLGRASNLHEAIVCLTYGIAIGSFLGAILPMWSIIMILIAISFYDLYSVFRGPLKELVELEKETIENIKKQKKNTNRIIDAYLLKGMSVPISEFRLGMGDVVLLSALTACAYLRPFPSYPRGFIVGMGTLVGLLILLRILVKKRRPLPALPLPSLIGITLLLISTALGL